MNLRERIENNLAVWLLSTLLTGFLAGIGAYKAVLEIAQLEVVPKVTLEQLKATAPIPAKSSPVASPSSTEGAADPRSVDAASIDKPPAPLSPAQVPELRLSTSASPLPEHYDSVRLGMKLSEAPLVLPGGRLSADYYSVELDSPLFSRVQFIALTSESDPKIGVIYFYFRDDAARQVVMSSLLKEFGSIIHKTESLGQRLIWPDVNGFRLKVDDNYEIRAKGE